MLSSPGETPLKETSSHKVVLAQNSDSCYSNNSEDKSVSHILYKEACGLGHVLTKEEEERKKSSWG